MKKMVLNKRIQGQGMTEYIIIVVCIAILSIAVIAKFGDSIRQLFFGAGQELTGEEFTKEGKMDSADVDQTFEDFGE